MGKDRAGEAEVRLLRALASDPARASSTKTATYDMMAHHLTRADVCDALWGSVHPDRPEAIRPGGQS